MSALIQFLEYIFYEAKPFAYAAIGGFACTYSDYSKIVAGAGVVLIMCSLLVFNLRFKYRLKRIR